MKIVTALSLFIFLLVGCAKQPAGTTPPTTDATLRNIVQAESDVDVGVAAALDITQKLYAAGTVDRGTAQTIAAVLAKVTAANAQAISVTKGLAMVDPAHRQAIWDIITPIIGALQDALKTGLVPLKDANAKALVSAALSGVLVTLQVIQANAGGS